MCYGALNLLVLADTSNFVPHVCDRAIAGEYAGEYEGPESTVSVAAEQSYHTRQTLAPVVPVWFRLTLRPNACFISLLSIIVPIPSFICTFVSSQVPSFVPQEKKSARCCRFESLSDSGFIAQNMAFYRPNKARTDISLANKRIT